MNILMAVLGQNTEHCPCDKRRLKIQKIGKVEDR